MSKAPKTGADAGDGEAEHRAAEVPLGQDSHSSLENEELICAEILQSRLFDVDWYRKSYLASRRVDPVRHYLCLGVFRGHDPNPLFVTDWYLARYPSVAEAGVNPLWHYVRFGAAEGRDPNPFFDTDWYVSAYKEVESSGLNPLAHYLHIGSASGLKPNRCFDPRLYLSLHPKAAAKGIDPLFHYMKRGQEKNLNLGPSFDYACYEQELSPTERKLFSSRLLEHYLTHGQRAGLRPNYRYDETRDKVRRAEFVAAIDSKLPTVLMICHNWGGGTEIHVRDLARLYRGRLNCLLLKVDRHGVARVALLERARELVLGFDSVSQLPELLSLISDVGTRRIHVHHVIGMNSFARLLVERCGLPFDFTAHDHSVLAPSPHLTGRDHRFVGEDLEAAEAELLAASRVKGAPDLASWRRDMSWLVTKSERVIAPSLDLARRLTKSLAPLSIIVAPHPDLSEQQSLEWTWPAPAEPLHIVTLGRLWPHKGFHVLLELARIAWEEALPLSFTHIGRSVKDEQLAELGVRVTGEYAERHLRLLLAKAKPHLIWFPAICPESFSYTLTAALRTELPLVVPDLGSFPERVAHRQWTWVRPWDTGPREWAKFFVAIRERHFLTGSPPDPAPEGAAPLSEVSHDFYDRRFLEWAEQTSPRKRRSQA